MLERKGRGENAASGLVEVDNFRTVTRMVKGAEMSVVMMEALKIQNASLTRQVEQLGPENERVRKLLTEFAERHGADQAEIGRLRDGIDAIRQYGSDTLRGPAKIADDTRDWQRDAVLEMTNRAVRVLGGMPWDMDHTKEELK